jgi:hypothetical protein
MNKNTSKLFKSFDKPIFCPASVHTTNLSFGQFGGDESDYKLTIIDDADTFYRLDNLCQVASHSLLKKFKARAYCKECHNYYALDLDEEAKNFVNSTNPFTRYNHIYYIRFRPDFKELLD